MTLRRTRHLGSILVSLLAITLTSGCGFFSSSSFGPQPTDTPVPRALVPTFTPTPLGQQPAEPQAVAPQPVEQPADQQPEPTPEPAP